MCLNLRKLVAAFTTASAGISRDRAERREQRAGAGRGARGEPRPPQSPRHGSHGLALPRAARHVAGNLAPASPPPHLPPSAVRRPLPSHRALCSAEAGRGRGGTASAAAAYAPRTPTGPALRSCGGLTCTPSRDTRRRRERGARGMGGESQGALGHVPNGLAGHCLLNPSEGVHCAAAAAAAAFGRRLLSLDGACARQLSVSRTPVRTAPRALLNHLVGGRRQRIARGGRGGRRQRAVQVGHIVDVSAVHQLAIAMLLHPTIVSLPALPHPHAPASCARRRRRRRSRRAILSTYSDPNKDVSTSRRASIARPSPARAPLAQPHPRRRGEGGEGGRRR